MIGSQEDSRGFWDTRLNCVGVSVRWHRRRQLLTKQKQGSPLRGSVFASCKMIQLLRLFPTGCSLSVLVILCIKLSQSLSAQYVQNPILSYSSSQGLTLKTETLFSKPRQETCNPKFSQSKPRMNPLARALLKAEAVVRVQGSCKGPCFQESLRGSGLGWSAFRAFAVLRFRSFRIQGYFGRSVSGPRLQGCC